MFLGLAGCRSTPPREPGQPLEAVAGKSVEGRPIHYWVFGTKGPVAYYLATIHGDETAGTPLLKELMLYFLSRPGEVGNRRVVIVPLVNPDGVAAGRRRNARNVDLNRDFGGFSQPETQALRDLFRDYTPAVIVSCHQPLRCVYWVGPALVIAMVLWRRCGLPVRKLGTRPGSLGSWAEDKKIPLITLEMPRSDDDRSDTYLARRYGPALLAALAFVGPVKSRAPQCR